MAYESFIGLRYLMAKQRSRVLSVITLLSVAGVALGVTAMIVVLSVMGGFKKDLKEKILGTKAHIVVRGPDKQPLTDPEPVLEAARSFETITGASPYVEAEAMVSSPTNLNGLILRGVEPETIGQVSDLPDEIVRGELEYLRDPTPLLEKLESRSDEEFDSLIETIEERKRRESSKEADAGTGGSGTSTGREAPDAGERAPSDEIEAILDDESASPIEDDTDSNAEDDGSSGGMPPIAGDDETSDSSSGGGMPPIAGGDDGDSESGGRGGMSSISGDEEEEEGETTLPGLLIGKELAKSLQVELGDEVKVVTPQGEMSPTGPIPRSRPFRIVGIFYTGMYEYDANFGYAMLSDTRDFLDREGVTGVELKTVDVERAMAIADRLQRELGDDYDVLDWKEMNRSLFYALKLEKIAMFVVLTFIILVASFSIIAMLIMIVLEKKRDIAVLKSMGMTRSGIMRIFIFQGVVIGATGAAIGLVLGLGICWALATFGYSLNSEVYYISQLPVEVDALEVGLVVFCTIAISFLATIYPSKKAADLQPVEGLRYE
jgi:lipoprotein-releasing system permease protein